MRSCEEIVHDSSLMRNDVGDGRTTGTDMIAVVQEMAMAVHSSSLGFMLSDHNKVASASRCVG